MCSSTPCASTTTCRCTSTTAVLSTRKNLDSHPADLCCKQGSHTSPPLGGNSPVGLRFVHAHKAPRGLPCALRQPEESTSLSNSCVKPAPRCMRILCAGCCMLCVESAHKCVFVEVKSTSVCLGSIAPLSRWRSQTRTHVFAPIFVRTLVRFRTAVPSAS